MYRVERLRLQLRGHPGGEHRMGRRNDTAIGATGGVFLTTHWSLIDEVGSGEEARNRALIGLLMHRYWKPVYCYLRRKGCDNEQAKDLTQGFFHEVVLRRRLIERADAAKGRFRSFLLMALDRYLVNAYERETAQKRRPKGRLVSLDAVDPCDLPASVAESSPEETFHYAWLSTLLERVLHQVQTQCHDEGKAVHWQVFRARVLDPITKRTAPLPFKEICAEHGIADEARASNMLITVKRRFKAVLRQHLRESVISDDHVAGEVEEIRRLFPDFAQGTA
jgi:RNA polymerase sigma-70 factor (ECF subfamily)